MIFLCKKTKNHQKHLKFPMKYAIITDSCDLCFDDKESFMIYICSHCQFIFERRGETIQCPHCGKYAVSEATKEEQEKFMELKEQNK